MDSIKLWARNGEAVQSSPKHPLHQCGNKPTLFHTVLLYAVCTSSNSHNCSTGKGNRA
jgi:hypothetical protein